MFLKIQIVNWAEHNPRADYKTMPWFKCSSQFYRSKKLHELPISTKWVCCSLYCMAAEENKSGLIEAHLDWMSEQIKVRPSMLSQAIEALEARGLITVTYVSRTADVREASCPRTYDVRYKENKDNEEKNTPESEPPPPPSDPGDTSVASEWAAFASSVSKTVKPSLPKWARVVKLLREKDGLSHEEIREMLAFVKSDHFWQHNAVSLEGLRAKSKNGLRKFENILATMRQRQIVTKPQEIEDLAGRSLDSLY